MTTNTVIGVYDRYNQAQNAFDELIAGGFSRNDVQLNPAEDTDAARKAALRFDEHATGSGIGHFFRSLFGLGQKNEHTDMYSEALRRGSYLLAVNTESEEQIERAENIMNRHDPVDIEERAQEWKNQAWTTTSGVSERSGEPRVQPQSELGSQAAIPVIREELQVGKREVQRGGVRVFQSVKETPVQEAVQLREEHVKVERHPVDHPATEADLAALKEGSFEVRETAEEPVVSKIARVVEEVVVGKDVTERKETISDTVRSTDVQVEQLGAIDDTDFRRHWQSAYGVTGGAYDDYAPAYRYGATLAKNERYRGYRWSDVEPDIRRDWETGKQGSAWDKAKDAIRYGWERVTK